MPLYEVVTIENTQDRVYWEVEAKSAKEAGRKVVARDAGVRQVDSKYRGVLEHESVESVERIN